MTEYRQMQMSDRKSRLFGVACCRRLSHLLDEEHCRRLIEFARQSDSLSYRNLEEPPLDSCRKAVELAERSADEMVSVEEMNSLSEAASIFYVTAEMYCETWHDGWGPFDTELVASCNAAGAVHDATKNYPQAADVFGQVRGAFDCLTGVVSATLSAFTILRLTEYGQEIKDDPKDRLSLCALLQDIVGNPFRPIAINPTWVTPTVTNLATAAYEHRALPSGELDTSHLAILADALEEGGCNHQEILGHLRSPDPHVRGCFAVDLLLGKE